MTAISARVSKEYERRRRRAHDLAERWSFATEVLQFYARLLDVQERAYDEAAGLDPNEAVGFAADTVVPRIVEVSAAHGPAALQQGVLERFDAVDLRSIIAAWLNGDSLDTFDRFLARASTAPLLEALGSRAGQACEGTREDMHCPVCGGLPQLAYSATSDEDLVTPHRFLLCSRCSASWPFARMTCPGCAENDTENLLLFSEIGALEAEATGKTVRGADAEIKARASEATMPHVAVDGCSSCNRYLLSIDTRREPRAVPIVDELAALPLYLYASERGLTKIVTNVLGF
jgi:formate dehydrogenase maturation protein FdhE